MKVKELIKILKTLDQEKEFLVSSDEELNIIYKDFRICRFTDTNQVAIYGLSGSEVDY